MNINYLLLCFFGIFICFVIRIHALTAIVGGEVVPDNAHEYQYQVTILIDNQDSTCGGGIIGNHYVLTAAHCVIASGQLIGKPISVLAQTYDLMMEPGLVFKVEKVFALLDYTHGTRSTTDDIAVLKLTSSLEIEKHGLMQLHLPKKKSLSFEHELARLAGFGWDTISKNASLGEHSDYRLRSALAYVHSHNRCQEDHSQVRIVDKNLCAQVVQHLYPADHPRGACGGDTGAPLVTNLNVVIGILSIINNNCRELNGSGIYTRVSHYLRFIHQSMNDTVTNKMRVLNA